MLRRYRLRVREKGLPPTRLKLVSAASSAESAAAAGNSSEEETTEGKSMVLAPLDVVKATAVALAL